MNEIMDILTQPLVLPIAVVLGCGVLVYFFSRWSPLICKLLGLAAGTWVLTSGIWIAKHSVAKFSWTWFELTRSISLTVDLATTPLGMVVMIGSGAFALLIAVYSLRAMAGHRWEGKFYAYLILALGGACIIAMAGNLLVLVVGWELVTLMLFLMVNQGGGEARRGGAKAYGVLGFADACLLLAVVLLVSMEGGSGNLSLMRGPIDIGEYGATGYLVYVLILIAALAKAGAVPLHTWMPAIAENAPTPVLAYLPGALDKLLGIYLLVTLTLRMFRPDWTMQVVMMLIGAVTILAAVLMAMMQHNLKRLLSFCAVSQVGYMVLGIGTGTTIGIIGGLFHMINHAIYKSNLFLMSGVVGRAGGTDEVEDMGGLARLLPVTFVCGLIGAAAVSGIPPFNGFISKWLVYQGTLEVSGTNRGLAIALVVVAVFGSALTLATFVKVMYSVFMSPRPKGIEQPTKRSRESFFMAGPMVILAAGCVVLGLWPELAINHVFLPALGGTGGEILAQGGAVSTGTLGFWNPSQATFLILIGMLMGLGFVWINTRSKRVRVVRPFLAGEVPLPGDDRFRVPGTDFYRTIGKLPLIGPLLEHGEGGAMDPYHWFGKHGNTLVQMLRSFHTGLINLYVVWCLTGLTIILVYLLVS